MCKTKEVLLWMLGAQLQADKMRLVSHELKQAADSQDFEKAAELRTKLENMKEDLPKDSELQEKYDMLKNEKNDKS